MNCTLSCEDSGWGSIEIPRFAQESRLDACQRLSGVAFGFHLGPDFLDYSGRIDEHRAARNALEAAAHELLHAPSAVGFNHFVVGIAQQREIESLLGAEALQQFDRIGADTNHDTIFLVEVFFCVTKLGRFDGSTGGVSFRVEEEQDALALEIAEGNLLTFIGCERKCGCLVTDFEHKVSVVIRRRIRKAACEQYRSQLGDLPAPWWLSSLGQRKT